MTPEEKEKLIERGDYIEDLDDDEEIDLDEIEDDEDGLQEEEGDESEEEVEDEDDIEEEEDEEDVEDSEEDEDDEEDEESDDEEEDHRIPKSRLDQVLRQRDEERERVAWLEEQLSTIIKNQGQPKQEEVVKEDTPPTYDFDTKEAQYIELILEGEVKDAAKLRQEINNARDSLNEWKMNQFRNESSQVAYSAIEEKEYQSLLKDTIRTFDIFNDQSDNYNGEAVQMANTLMSGYMQQGMSKKEALANAVRRVTPFYTKEEQKAEPQKKVSDRNKTATKKAVKASKAQPPKTKSSRASKRSLDNVDLSKMSERQYAKLTAKEKAILRGDF
jgi:hypothetical protein